MTVIPLAVEFNLGLSNVLMLVVIGHVLVDTVGRLEINWNGW